LTACCLLQNALDENYCRPEVNETTTIDIQEGRHPVIEKQLPVDEAYVSNSICLDDQEQQVVILTGPICRVNPHF
jgi:DNA mismatch repair protein MutS